MVAVLMMAGRRKRVRMKRSLRPDLTLLRMIQAVVAMISPKLLVKSQQSRSKDDDDQSVPWFSTLFVTATDFTNQAAFEKKTMFRGS